jgi:hypothetical protein
VPTPLTGQHHVLPQDDDDAAGDPTDLYADILGPDSDGPSRASSKSSVATPASSVALPPLKPPGVCVLVCVSGVLWSLPVCVAVHVSLCMCDVFARTSPRRQRSLLSQEPVYSVATAATGELALWPAAVRHCECFTE